MSLLSSSWNQCNGLGRRGADRELVGSVMKLAQRASGLMYISMGQPDLQFRSNTVMSTIAKPLEITTSRLRTIARYLEDKPVLEYVCAY